MVMEGLVTSVSMRVDSITSTCLCSRLGDMRVRSAPKLPISSGALPGQISRTVGSAAVVPEIKRQTRTEMIQKWLVVFSKQRRALAKIELVIKHSEFMLLS